MATHPSCANTSQRKRSTRSPLPGDLLSRFPATFSTSIPGERSHVATTDGLIPRPGTMIK